MPEKRKAEKTEDGKNTTSITSFWICFRAIIFSWLKQKAGH